MTQVNIDFTLYTNARKWMDGLGIKRDDADDTKLNMKSFLDKMLYDSYVMIGGTQKNGRKIRVIVVSVTNSFSRIADTKKVLANIPSDGSIDGVIISEKVLKSLDDVKYILNVPHFWMYTDVRMRVDAPEYEIIRGEEMIAAEGIREMTDCDKESLEKLPKARVSIDPFLFWIGAQKGDLLKLVSAAEDVSVFSTVLIVV